MRFFLDGQTHREFDICIVTHERNECAWACIEPSVVPGRKDVSEHASWPSCWRASVLRNAFAYEKWSLSHLVIQRKSALACSPRLGISAFAFLRAARRQGAALACHGICVWVHEWVDMMVHAGQSVLQALLIHVFQTCSDANCSVQKNFGNRAND